MMHYRLSENTSLLFVCYQFLLDRQKNADYNGPLSRVMLETMTLFTTLSDEKMEKTHLVKLLPRFVNRGDAKTQGYTKRILSSVISAKKESSTEPPKSASSKSASASSPTIKRQEPEPVAGIKRAASTAGEGGTQKKLATAGAKSTSSLSMLKQSAATKKSAAVTESTKPPAQTIVKAKPVVAKPSGMFSSLQSAQKRPGASNVVPKAGQQSIAASKPSDLTVSVSSAAPKSTFSFAETMANLSKPKEEKIVPKQSKEVLNETAEGKAKRLRKEARRSLRVQFKSGDDLVQVRIFHHDVDEEEGHDASQRRDVGDVGGEGRMFKQQHQMMDIDEDEDAAEEEEKLLEFKTPLEIDFSDVDEEERKRNYAPFGGGYMAPESEERAARDYYEANNLIVFYTDSSDIPPNPREPSDPTNGKAVTLVKDFAKPEDKWAARARQKKAIASPYFGSAPQGFNANTMNAAAGLDLSKLPAFTNNQPQPNNAFQPPQPPSTVDAVALSSLIASLQQSGGIQAAPTPPQMSYAPPPPPMNMQPQAPVPPPGGQIDLAGILAQLSAQAPQMTGYNNYNAAGTMPNTMSYNAQPPSFGTYEDPARKQFREDGGQRANNGPNPYYKTKVCKYWQMNMCQKGDKCTYKHAE